MGHSKNNKKTKIIPDLERIIPDDLNAYSRRLLQEHIDRYEFAVPYIHNEVVVDIACGSGYGSYILASNGAKKIIGVDLDSQTIKYARSRYSRRNITYQIGNACDLNIPSASADVIVSFETIEHIKKPRDFLNESRRILIKSGTLIISTPNKKCSMGDNPFHMREYNLNEFIRILRPHFSHIELYGQRPVFRPIISVYHFLSRIIPLWLHPLLHMRPWEKLDIKKINNLHDDGYVYFIAICQK